MKSILKESKISLNNIHECILLQTPPWIIKKPDVIFELNELPKNKNLSEYLSGEISQYPPTPSQPPICLYGWLQGQ